MIDRKNNLIKTIKEENILEDAGTLEAYSKDESFTHPLKPWYVVKPQNANQVQALVQWANQTSTPLIPVSSGPPHFRGDTVPSVPGAVIVDLSGMNRIVSIDRRDRIAHIEPGVSYSQLQPELAKAGLWLTTPLLPRSNKSVIASLLEREPILVTRHQWSALDPLRSTEIVWGDGQKFRTGDAGNWASLEVAMQRKQAGIGSQGPGQTDYYRLVSAAQGSMGIVTWASVKCEVLPEIHKFFLVTSPKLESVIDFMYKVLRFRYGDELFLLNNFSLASILTEGTERIRELKNELPPWAVVVGISGGSVLPRERVEFQEKDISDIAQQTGLRLVPSVPGAANSEVSKAVLGASPEPYWKSGYKGGWQEIFFLTTLNKTPQFIKTMHSLAEANGYPVSDIGIYIQPLHQGVNCHCEFILPFAKNNAREEIKMRDLFTRASGKLLDEGAFFSRPYGIWANMAYNRDAQTTSVLKKLKGIFDPNNVMNPGKLCF